MPLIGLKWSYRQSLLVKHAAVSKPSPTKLGKNNYVGIENYKMYLNALSNSLSNETQKSHILLSEPLRLNGRVFNMYKYLKCYLCSFHSCTYLQDK